jgi:hypothetical protein
MASQTQDKTWEIRAKNWAVYAAIFGLVAATILPMLQWFRQWLNGGAVPWHDASEAAPRVGFAVVVMGAVVACCILLLRLRTFPADQDRPPPSLVPAVVLVAIGSMVVSTAMLWK